MSNAAVRTTRATVLHPREPAPRYRSMLEGVGGLHLVIETLPAGRCDARGSARRGQPPEGQDPMEPPRRTIRRRHTLGDRPKSQPSLSKRQQKDLAPAAKDWREAAYSLGILKTGYLETASEAWDRNIRYTCNYQIPLREADVARCVTFCGMAANVVRLGCKCVYGMCHRSCGHVGASSLY